MNITDIVNTNQITTNAARDAGQEAATTIRARAKQRAEQLNLIVRGNPHGYWGHVETARGIYVCQEESLGKAAFPEWIHSAIAKASDLTEAEAIVAELATMPAEVTWTKSVEWGPGPRSVVRIACGGWHMSRQLSGLPMDYTNRPVKNGVPDGERGRKIRILVREHLNQRIDAALAVMPEPGSVTLPMTRGDANDRRMGWNEWPSGPDHVENVTKATA